MTKEEKKKILFGKSENQVVNTTVHWNNDTACLPIFEQSIEKNRKTA